jgi:hypothetical protein
MESTTTFFTLIKYSDLVFEILGYLSWEEIILLGSCSKEIFKQVNRVVKQTEIAEEKAGTAIRGLIFSDYDFVDDGVKYQAANINQIMMKMVKKLPDFKYSYHIDRMCNEISRYVFLHPCGDQIHSIYAGSSDSIIENDGDGCFDTLLEYRSIDKGILIQIGTIGSHPFLYLKDPDTNEVITWGQSDGSSYFPFVKTEEKLHTILPFYEKDFADLDPKTWKKMWYY